MHHTDTYTADGAHRLWTEHLQNDMQISCGKVFSPTIISCDLHPYLSFSSSQLINLAWPVKALIRTLTWLAVPFIYIPQAKAEWHLQATTE